MAVKKGLRGAALFFTVWSFILNFEGSQFYAWLPSGWDARKKHGNRQAGPGNPDKPDHSF